MVDEEADVAPGEHSPDGQAAGEHPATEPGGCAHSDSNPGVDAEIGEEFAAETEAHPLLAAYRHDMHKLRGRQHDAASEEFAGVCVNEPVPLGADADAALLSRPALDGEPEYKVANHRSWQRLSLVTGEAGPDLPIDAPETPEAFEAALRDLVRIEDPEAMHRAWLLSDIAATVAETPHDPYTSAKYHTLLVGTLLDNYRVGHSFEDLYLVADAGGEDAPEARQEAEGGQASADAGDRASRIVPHHTVFWAPNLALHITGSPGDRPAARLGDAPARSFADTWSRLPFRPIAHGTNTGDRAEMLLDAQLRRIRSWSTALAFIEDFLAWAPVEETPQRSAGGDG